MKLDTRENLSMNTLILHWVVAVMMIGLLATGVYMTENEVFRLYNWHKSFGVLVIVFVVLRVIWRIKNGWLSPVRDFSRIEEFLSKIVHYLLIFGTLLMPISGFMMSSMSGHGVALFGIELVARVPNPENPNTVIPINDNLQQIGHIIHKSIGYMLIAGVIIHVIGALKHHIIDNDRTLKRMLGVNVQ